MCFYLNYDPPSSPTGYFVRMFNATVIVSSFDKIVANSFDQKITHNTVVHKKAYLLPNFSKQGRERANRNNFKCGLT